MIPTTRAYQYIGNIRNKHKRDYARRYLEYLRGLLRNEPQGSAAGISSMAAQAVRMELNERTKAI